ncbi:phosphopantetheine-binding protein [Staphylococcus aureus]
MKDGQTFVDVFGEVLKQNDVGVDDDFFELGGNSLEAMLVVSHLKRFGRDFVQCRHYTNIKPCDRLLIICTKINNH